MAIVGLESKSYTGGSSFPDYKDGKIRLYSMRFCPFNQRALLALAAKNLGFEVININLKTKPEWFLTEINPLGKVPTVQYNGKIIYESLIVAEWLDEEFPKNTPKLLPDCPYEKAKQKMLVERLSKLIPIFYTWVREKTAQNLEQLKNELKRHEDLLTHSYYAGNEPGFVDYMLWPALERCDALCVGFPEVKALLNAQNFPKLTAYIERMKQRPEVKKVARSPEEHLKYFEGVVSGNPNYDLGL